MVHERKGKGKRRKPHFFKVLLGDFNQRLKLPPNFLKHISNGASQRVTLEGPGGHRWCMELIRSSDGTFLSHGWSNFVQDHSLKEREFLVFRYDGNMHFVVQIFDKTACEREDLFTIQPNRTPKINEGKNTRHAHDDCCLLDPQEIKNEQPDLLTDDNSMLKESQDDQPKSTQGGSGAFSSPGGGIKNKAKTKECPNCMIVPNPICQRGFFSERDSAIIEEKLHAREAANSFSSVFPFLIRQMTVTSVNKRCLLRFPKSFGRAHLPASRTDMIMRDPNGKAWVVAFLPNHNKKKKERDRFSKQGWGAFGRGNRLEEGDYCAFELIAPIEIRVHIFRASSSIHTNNSTTAPALSLSLSLDG